MVTVKSDLADAAPCASSERKGCPQTQTHGGVNQFGVKLNCGALDPPRRPSMIRSFGGACSPGALVWRHHLTAFCQQSRQPCG